MTPKNTTYAILAGAALLTAACGPEIDEPPLPFPNEGGGGTAEVGSGGAGGSTGSGEAGSTSSTGGSGGMTGTGGGGSGETPIEAPLYRVVLDGGRTWDEARSAAPTILLDGVAGHLATANTQDEVNDLQTIGLAAPGPLWLGGYQDTAASDYAEPGGGWYWVTGEPFTLANWSGGEPNHARSDENYLELWANGNWADAPPSNPGFNTGFVIEYEPEDIAPVFNPSTGSYYLAVPGHYVTWDEAREAARSLYFGDRQGDLVSITSAAEQAFIHDEVGFDHYWLGGYQDDTAGDFAEPAGGWRWVSGETFSYTAWASGEPNEFNGIGEQWLSSGPGGSWNDNEEYWDYTPGNEGFIVEFD